MKHSKERDAGFRPALKTIAVLGAAATAHHLDRSTAPRRRQEVPKPAKRRPHPILKIIASVTAGATFGAGAVGVVRQVETNNEHKRDLSALTHKVDDLDQQLSTLRESAQRQSDLNDRLAQILANQTGESKDRVTGATLKQLHELPGYGFAVSPELRGQLQASTVKIGVRAKNDENGVWRETCTGVKVSDGDQTYVLSASHCFSPDAPTKMGISQKPLVLDISATSSNEYIILDPQSGTANQANAPVASVSGVAIDLSGGSDWALLKAVGNGAGSARIYDQIPSLPLGQFIMSEQTPVPGESVGLYSLPAANNNLPVAAEGIYLGRTPGAPLGYPADFIDFIATPAPDVRQDACDYGASGSAAVFTGGNFSGPLYGRNSIGYSDGSIEPGDAGHDNLKQRLDIEQTLGVEIPSDMDVCAFSTTSVSIPTVPSLEGVLADPNNFPTEQITPDQK
ncbi:MAG TPA: hypothetical protein VLF87_02405 [Patescibacteria group bacterium]|nr:hypothetical protein [Patescibacteria group bacterium]